MTRRKSIEGVLDTIKSHHTSELFEFGQDVLRVRRLKLNLTQAEMADRIGIDQSRIARLEGGLGTPKDHATAEAFVRCYQLTEDEANKWFQLIFGIRRSTAYGIEHGRSLFLVENTIEEMQIILNTRGYDREYNYFGPYGLMHKQPLFSLDASWNRIAPLIMWLTKDGGYLKGCLLIELGASITHYLAGKGDYFNRLRIALAAAEAASELGNRVVQGWLLADAIPWTLMAQYNKPAEARSYLELALRVGYETGQPDIVALATAFLARTYAQEGKVSESTRHIDGTSHMNCSSAVQARIHWVLGDIAFLQGRIRETIAHYNQARALSPDFGGGLRLGQCHIALDDLSSARNQFTALIALNQKMSQSPHKIALGKYGLAQVAKLERDNITARQLMREAMQLLQTTQRYPRLELDLTEMGQFYSDLKGPKHYF